MSAALLVVDSGPLIALARLDLLDLPARYFDSVLVTSTVWEEVMRKPRDDEGPRLASAVSGKSIEVVPGMDNTPASVMRQTIDAGERSAIALGIELNASLLMDDRVARKVAIELGRPVIGTLGLLLRAREDDFVPALRPLIEKLRVSGYYLSADLVGEILSIARE
jgi:predicted nucleic acid-binding protein